MLKLTAVKMKNLDRKAQEHFGMPGIILMENAGAQAATKARIILKTRRKKSVSIFCGPGNNGGDGLVVARHLLNHGVKVEVFLLGSVSRLKGDVRTNYIILKKMKANIHVIKRESELNLIATSFKKTGLIIDAIFGIGLNKDIRGLLRNVIELINESKITVVSLDVPSGLCATTGKVFGVCIKAHATVTFGALKTGFFKNQGRKMTGKLFVVDISLPRQLLN